MRVCLDTNAYSDLRRGDSRIRDVLDRADEVIVPAAVVGELQLGFLRGSKCAENERMLSDFLAMPCVKFQPATRGIAERYGYVKAALWKEGKAIPENDIWIAATALESGSRLLTRDAHFNLIGGLIKIHVSAGAALRPSGREVGYPLCETRTAKDGKKIAE